MRNSSVWLAEVVRMPKSSVYIQLSNGGFFAVADFFKYWVFFPTAEFVDFCSFVFTVLDAYFEVPFAHFASIDCKGGWVQFFVSNFLKEKRVFRCPCVVWNLLGHSYFRDVGCTQSKDLTSFKVFVFRLLQNCEKQLSGSSCLFGVSIILHTWNNWVPSGQIFKRFYIWVFLENEENSSLIKTWWEWRGTLHGYLWKFVMPDSVCTLRNVWDKSWREQTQLMFSNFFPKIVPFMR